MKRIIRFTLVVLIFIVAAGHVRSQTAADVEALARQGNYREAADLGKAALAKPGAGSWLLRETLGALRQLGLAQEQEEVIEAAVAAHPNHVPLLIAAARGYLEIEHGGMIIDGKFQRGQYRDQGRQVQVFVRDRVRALQLLDAARRALPANPEPAEAAMLYDTLRGVLSQGNRGHYFHSGGSTAWSLQHLTDLSQLPDFDAETGLDEPATGYPVDRDGNPIFFKTPATWDAAASDGERLAWALDQKAALNAHYSHEAQIERAALARAWFSVQTLARHGFRIADVHGETEGSARSAISALHTLKDDETAARLATGPKRFPLPPEWSFLTLYRATAEDADAPNHLRVAAWRSIAEELTDRRQFPSAVEAYRQALALESHEGTKVYLQSQIDQIVGHHGRFEVIQAQPAGTEARLPLVFRNATRASFTARQVDMAKLVADVEAYLRSEPQEQNWQRMNLTQIGQRLLLEDGGKYLTPITATWEQELEPRPNHWDKRVEIATPLSKAGAWFVEATFEGGNVARALFWIEDLVIVKTRQASAGHYFVANAVTGAPAAGASVRFFGYKQEWKEPGAPRQRPRMSYIFRDFQLTSDAQGQVIVPEAQVREFQWLTTAAHDGSFACLGFQHFWFGDGRERFGEQPRIYGITDRPVYRPGQEVKWKAWARMVGYDSGLETNAFAHKSIQAAIWDPRNEKVAEKTYVADDSGSISDALLLGDGATLGVYRIEFSGAIHGGHSFRVEEYKKPEFEVKIDAPTKPVALGDAFEVKVKADYYFGGPVKEGKVAYKVRRTTHVDRWFPVGPWDWLFGPGYAWRAAFYDWYPGSQDWCFCRPRWPWLPWRSDPPELVASGEAPLNDDGTFTIKVDAAPALELHGNEDHRYDIEAEVTDPSRRTIFGKGSVLAARRPFEVYVWLDRGYYRAGDGGEVRISARTLDGRAVTAAGKLRLMRVTYDASGKPQEEEVAVFDVKAGEDEARQKVKWDRAGQYRVAAELTDEAGHVVEGVSFVTVRGEGFGDGNRYRFDDLELIPERNEYEPGEEVELTLNTNRDGSTIGLFVRTENGTYPPPVWLKLEGKSTTYRFKLTEADQPNLFIDAYTVSNARLHQVTQQIIVPPKKRVATVELEPDQETYLPRQGAKVKVRVRDQDGEPFVGKVVLTAYDKALEYISGGSNQPDIRSFFWGWKRNHHPQVQDSFRAGETHLIREGEVGMQQLGLFDAIADLALAGRETLGVGSATVRSGRMVLGEGRFTSGWAIAESNMDLAAAPAAAGAKAEAAALDATSPMAIPAQDGAVAGAEPMIRSNLADSAVWVADFTSDAQGHGELNFAMPDNLTAWKLRAWVAGPKTQVGEAAVEVITRKNLMVRLQAPRFFVEKDEAVISANVHNETDAPQEVRAVLELEGGVLEFVEPSDPSVFSVPSHSQQRVDRRVRVTGEGEAKIRVKALAEAESDAMEMRFPAYIHGMLKTDSWSLGLRPDEASGAIAIRVPEERKPEQSRLEVRFSPTLAMALIDALAYLVDYPYGCTEQTLNRFVPTVITLNVLKDLGVNLADVRAKRTNLNAQEIGDPKTRAQRWQGKDRKGDPKEAVFDEDEVRKMAKAGVDRLLAMRNGDGGWGWFPGGRDSSPHITAVVMHGLHTARQAGFEVNEGLMREGAAWLQRHELEQLRRLRLPPKDRDHKAAPDNLDALIHSVLVEHDVAEAGMRTLLYEKRQQLSRYNLALLGLACHQRGETERRDMCLRNLRQFLKQDDENQTAWLELPPNAWWWIWYDDEIETQAAFLRLLSAVEPRGDVAPRIAKFLLNNRRNGTWWRSTKDTAAVIEALAAYVKASGEDDPRLTVEVLVDGKSGKQVEITRDNLFSFDGSHVIEGDALTAGEHRIELRKLGEAPLYVNAYLTVFTREEMIPAAGLEVKARRKFYRLIEEKPEQQVAGSRGQVVTQQGFKFRREELASDAPVNSGELIEVELTIESKNDYEYVIIEDMKPAGFEPIEVQSGWDWRNLPAYREFRDEKVAFFAERLPRGTHNLSYRVKAEIPGRFSALPAVVSAMYAPELQGNSSEWKARIDEE